VTTLLRYSGGTKQYPNIKEEVLNSGVSPAIKGKHKNHVIPYNKLKTMNTIVDVFFK